MSTPQCRLYLSLNTIFISVADVPLNPDIVMKGSKIKGHTFPNRKLDHQKCNKVRYILLLSQVMKLTILFMNCIKYIQKSMTMVLPSSIYNSYQCYGFYLLFLHKDM